MGSINFDPSFGAIPDTAANNVFDGGTDKLGVATSNLLNTDTTDKTNTALTPAVAAVAPTAVAPAVVAPETTETPLTFSDARTSEAPVPVAMVDVDVNGKTQQVAVNPATTGTTSTATSAVEGASAEEVKAFNSVLADVDAKVGKTASNATERAKNVAEFRSKLSGSKLTEFDASMKSAAEKTGANFGRNEWKTDASKLSSGTQAVLSKYAAGWTGTPTTESKAETVTPTKKTDSTATTGTGAQKLSDSTRSQLRTAFNETGNAAAMETRLTEGKKDGAVVSKTDLGRLGLDADAQAELTPRVFGKKQTASAAEVIQNLRTIQLQDSAARL